MRTIQIAPVLFGVLLCFSTGSCGHGAANAETKSPASAPAQKPKDEIHLTAAEQQQAGIQSMVVTERAAPSETASNGTVVPDENRTWHLSSFVLGQVAKMNVGMGDRVRKDQVIARLHTHEVHDSRAAYQQAVAGLNDAKAQQNLANRAHGRAERLLTLLAISKSQLEQADADVARATAMVDTANAAVTREKTHLIEVLGVALEDDGSEDAETAPVKSPANGIVLERSASIGTVLNPGSPIVTVSDLRSLWIIAAVNEENIAAVKLRQPVTIRVKAYPDRLFRGTVTKLGDSLDPVTRTLQVRVNVDNSDLSLRPQMFAALEFEGKRQRQSITLPVEAIQELNGERVVFVQTGHEVFRPRVVQPGQGENGRMEIASGLKPGERVAVKGVYSLKTELLKSSLSGDD